MEPRRVGWVLALYASCVTGTFAAAAVPPEQAQRLRTTLTPDGAEKAGNQQGTIPEWTGGYTTVWKGYKSGQPRPDPFADEKPILRITAANADEYTDKLSEGIKALLKRFPSYRLDIYPTHRTAAAPQWVYDDTFRNATRARTTHGGVSIEGAYGGIPFPIPTTGAEVMWNHLLQWSGESARWGFRTLIVAGGRRILASGGTFDAQWPYYDKDGSLEKFRGIFGLIKLLTTAPPFRVGENLLVHDPVDQFGQGRRAWQYLVGQHRVRRAPTISYDNPDTVASGYNFFDEAFMFNGALDRYDWKLLGKREMFIPYNCQDFHVQKVDVALGPDHVNPDHLRWELHRVWVVEATLASGKRHVMPKRRFYVDEDTWAVASADGWDAGGRLWHVSHSVPMIVPEVPAVVTIPYIIYDFQKRGYVAGSLFNEGGDYYEVMPHRPEDAFSPAALAAEGVR
jgi:hypothetical protein